MSLFLNFPPPSPRSITQLLHPGYHQNYSVFWGAVHMLVYRKWGFCRGWHDILGKWDQKWKQKVWTKWRKETNIKMGASCVWYLLCLLKTKQRPRWLFERKKLVSLSLNCYLQLPASCFQTPRPLRCCTCRDLRQTWRRKEWSLPRWSCGWSGGLLCRSGTCGQRSSA